MHDPASLRERAARARILASETTRTGRPRGGRDHLLNLAAQFEEEAELLERAASKPGSSKGS